MSVLIGVGRLEQPENGSITYIGYESHQNAGSGLVLGILDASCFGHVLRSCADGLQIEILGQAEHRNVVSIALDISDFKSQIIAYLSAWTAQAIFRPEIDAHCGAV